jgi:hypothetical protein
VILYMVHDVRDPRLALHVRPGHSVRHAVFDWDVVPPPVDAGPPSAIAAVFAEALAETGRVAFVDTPIVKLPEHAWHAVGGDAWLPLARRFREPRAALVATRDPARIRTMFSSIAIWSQQNQAGFVLRDGALPMLSRPQVERVITARDVAFDQLALPDEVRALVMPAVDGAYIEVAARDDRMFDHLRDEVAAACRARGIAFEDHGGRNRR